MKVSYSTPICKGSRNERIICICMQPEMLCSRSTFPGLDVSAFKPRASFLIQFETEPVPEQIIETSGFCLCCYVFQTKYD